MSDIAAPPIDRRVARTREALRTAFRELFFSRGYDDFGVAEIAERANIGRSTFYKHFDGKDDLLAWSLGHFLAVIAEACVSETEPAGLVRVTGHFWDNRGRARFVFSGPAVAVLTRLLAGMIEDRLPRLGRSTFPQKLAAHQLAVAQLSLMDQWLQGRGSCTAAELASAMHRSGYAAARGLMAA